MAHLSFQLDYHAACGQQICICGSVAELGGFDEGKALPLANSGSLWRAELEVESAGTLQYYYFVRENSANVRREWGGYRELNLVEGKSFFVSDNWKNAPAHQYLYSSVFTDSVFARPMVSHTAYPAQALLLNVACPYVGKNQKLVICGENPALGAWDLGKALPLDYVRAGEWEILLDASVFEADTPYKFVIVDAENACALHWEDGDNRVLHTDFVSQGRNGVQVQMGLEFCYADFEYRGIGTAIPVFSLRSEDSFGIGDFIDLKKMIDWVACTHQQIIQLLPINDTTTSRTWRDSYPYSAISIYALHPIYLNCKSLPLKEKSRFQIYLEKAKALNALPSVDYEAVLRLKTDYSRDLFEDNGVETLSSTAYKAFFESNKEWLFPYACFCYLRDGNRSARFADWGEFAKYDKGRLVRMLDRNAEASRETGYHCYLQFLLHEQLSDVKDYAHAKGVALKGDIPIGIHRYSVDAWTNTALFNMDTQTGAPPDDFSLYGQNWGFPTYNWAAMEGENYAWWKSRFRKMADYFDAYRIDHILGFFRIWEIPHDAVQGLLGHFKPALPYGGEEIAQAGIPFDEQKMAQAFIYERFLPEIFGQYAEEVKYSYLNLSDFGRCELKSFCDTQQKIKRLFEGRNDEKSDCIRKGLYALCCEMLFVCDGVGQNRFHPRITAQYTHAFQCLNDDEKTAFNRLYDEFFYRRHNDFWRSQALKKLPELISSTSMMVCGEDLGMVPECVPAVMRELQILSLEIQRMPKTAGTRFSDLKRLPYLSVCTTSSHDMSPIRAWWLENRDDTQYYYNEMLGHDGVAPTDCTPNLCEEIIANHLCSNAMWVILPWQDWLSIDENLRRANPEDERINLPSDPENYWRYRMHISLEELLGQTDFNEKIKELGGQLRIAN
ncbi:MAG: 4-alpha-glucanotransferase [Dysgonamonadaceae bacterium]|jgi:4-alpha-glucanotransferase|nr:4-alpha-glucanotransferase [Dysgonamonadaceae bacterium]